MTLWSAIALSLGSIYADKTGMAVENITEQINPEMSRPISLSPYLCSKISTMFSVSIRKA
jgi:hypothetical protein